LLRPGVAVVAEGKSGNLGVLNADDAFALDQDARSKKK
jgi:hypothetical protein